MKKKIRKRQLLAVAMVAALLAPQGVYAAEDSVDLSAQEAGRSAQEMEEMVLTSDEVNEEYMLGQNDKSAAADFVEFLSTDKETQDILEDQQQEAKNPLSVEKITDGTSLLEILQYTDETETAGKNYVLANDIIITETEYSQLTTGSDTPRVFAGTFDGDDHTITVEGDGGPLFEVLRGSVSNLKLVFEGDVTGAPFAIDAGAEDNQPGITLENINVEVQGDILPADHDYSKYYGSLLAPPYNYGNWYIHYGGEAQHLATGFAWYLWGASAEDVSVTVNGNVGTTDRLDGDTTATGFAYFAAQGDALDAVKYENISVDVTGDIQSYTGDGHASAYGFAVGNSDSSAGFGCNTLEEFSNVTVYAENIIADSEQGSSSAFGMARYLQGYTHDCEVNVKNEIKAVNEEGDAEEDVYAYSNGDAYAYGFMLNTGGWSIDSRRNFENNTVNVGAITARTDSETYAGAAFASGFAHQMMNTASSVPDLSYNHNKVNITKGDITANANAGGAVAAGFVTSSGRDYYDRPDHIYENSVYVKGSITATSQQADATAAGYSYTNKTHRRDCDVTVEGDIIAESPVQAISAGFNGLQSIDSYYFIKNADVKVYGDIRAVQTGDEEGIAIAAGLNAAVMSGSASTVVSFNGNKVEVNGTISSEKNKNAGSEASTGLIIGWNEQTDQTKGILEISNNQFIGRESLIQIDEADKGNYPGFYTLFADVQNLEVVPASNRTGNAVQFTDEKNRTYRSDVELLEEPKHDTYGSMWELTKIEEVAAGYEITATAEDHGTIDPSGTVKVKENADQTFVITSDTGYVIDEVLADGKAETEAAEKTTYEYTFNNVTASHTIHATFKEKEESGGGSSSSGGSHTSNTYYVRYHNDDDTVKDGRFIPGETVTVRGDIFTAPRGKVLAGWSLEEEGKVDYKVGDTFRMPGSSYDLYAVWKDAETMTHDAYISGYPDGTVGPDRTITRAEAAAMFYNLLSDKNGAARAFKDVPVNQWYTNAVTTLAGMGVINGYPDGTFKPDAPITRAEFVTMAMNFAKAEKGAACSFADVSQNMWYYGAVAGATENGWISGYPDGTFGPDRYITRAEVTSVINRMENRTADITFIVENLKDLRTFSDLSFQHWAYGSMMEAANGHEYTREQENTYEVWTGIK